MSPTADLPAALDALLAQMEDQARQRGLPWVTLSYAQSLDGSIAARRGAPLALSGPATLEITHRLRARHETILVGIGTLLADDPRLNVRLAPGDDPQPVVLDSRLRFPLEARLLRGRKPPWIMTSQKASPEREAALVQAGVRVFRAATERIKPGEVLQLLAGEGVCSLMVEGGAQVITAFLQARLVDALVITVSPLLVGGVKAVEGLLSNDETASGPEGFPRLEKSGVLRLGDDLLVWGRPRWFAEG